MMENFLYETISNGVAVREINLLLNSNQTAYKNVKNTLDKCKIPVAEQCIYVFLYLIHKSANFTIAVEKLPQPL